MMRLESILLGWALIASTATAQVRPEPGPGDPRIQTVEYHRDQVVQISASPGYQVTIQLAPDEQIQTVAVGDSAAWQATANRSGNLLFVKATQGGVDTNMTVITNARFYAFDLSSAQGGSPPYEVRFQYPEIDRADAVVDAGGQEKIAVGLYRFSGARALQPRGITDDGQKTYIDWAPEVPLPAVFIIDERGRETLANGNMRGSLYVIDSVYDRLLFRIDRESGRATRVAPKPARK